MHFYAILVVIGLAFGVVALPEPVPCLVTGATCTGPGAFYHCECDNTYRTLSRPRASKSYETDSPFRRRSRVHRGRQSGRYQLCYSARLVKGRLRRRKQDSYNVYGIYYTNEQA
jgi:hypothetical protein